MNFAKMGRILWFTNSSDAIILNKNIQNPFEDFSALRYA